MVVALNSLFSESDTSSPFFPSSLFCLRTGKDSGSLCYWKQAMQSLPLVNQMRTGTDKAFSFSPAFFPLFCVPSNWHMNKSNQTAGSSFFLTGLLLTKKIRSEHNVEFSVFFAVLLFLQEKKRKLYKSIDLSCIVGGTRGYWFSSWLSTQ